MIDAIGYRAISSTGDQILLHLMGRRYEQASTVLTNNKLFEEWGEVFGDDTMAAALIDSLLYRCYVGTIRDNNRRM